MIAGLLFAVHDAEDRPDRLTATLPFAGTTLIEYQARLLVAAGASQIVVVVSKLTPDLLGAISRIGRRGGAVDVVRTASEAAEKLHPLSRVLVLADGLVTDEAVVRQLAGEGGDTLLVVDEDGTDSAFERIGGRLAWAGAARLSPTRLREVAAMPRDYDMQSALLRAACQARAAHLRLPAGAVAEGHGVERRADALEARSRKVLAAAMSQESGWFDRWIVAPAARWTLPALVTRGAPAGALALAGTVLGMAALACIHADLYATGLALALAGVIAWAVGGALADVRDEPRLARGQALAGAILPALAASILTMRLSHWSGDTGELMAGVSLLLFGLFAERGLAGRKRRLWWGSPGAYLIVLLAAALLASSKAGLFAAELYAAATLFAVIERLRGRA